MVDEPQAGSPAAKAGIQSGDVITAVNGTPVKDARELARTIGTMAPDATVKLDVIRGGQAKTISLTLGANAGPAAGQSRHRQRAADRRRAASRPVGGAGERSVRRRRQGVVVTAVDPDGPAAEQGFQTGNVILDVGGKAVANAGDVRKALVDAKAQGKHQVLMRVKMGDATRFVALPLGDA